MSDITGKEAEALLKFRDKLSDLKLNDEKNSDAYLIRWLRARELNLKKAEEMLRASLKWREESNIDSILEWKAPDKYKALYPMELCGYDKEGYPVLILPSRFTDPEAFFDCDLDEYMRYCTQSMEKVMGFMKKHSTPEKTICQCVLIYDLDQVNFRPYMNKKLFEFSQESSKFFNENYPEVIHKAYFVNSPKLFTVLFSMIKHVIPKRSQEKFSIFGFNKDVWVAELLSHIPADQLPVRYGGTDSEFEKTAFLICKIPWSNRLLGDKLSDGFIAGSVPAGKKLKLEYKVEEPKSLLKWDFKTENHDVGFAIHLDGKELVNHGRVDSHKKGQEGLLVCEREGEYAVIFENTYSRLRSKIIYYRVEVLSPCVTILSE